MEDTSWLDEFSTVVESPEDKVAPEVKKEAVPVAGLTSQSKPEQADTSWLDEFSTVVDNTSSIAPSEQVVSQYNELRKKVEDSSSLYQADAARFNELQGIAEKTPEQEVEERDLWNKIIRKEPEIKEDSIKMEELRPAYDQYFADQDKKQFQSIEDLRMNPALADSVDKLHALRDEQKAATQAIRESNDTPENKEKRGAELSAQFDKRRTEILQPAIERYQQRNNIIADLADAAMWKWKTGEDEQTAKTRMDFILGRVPESERQSVKDDAYTVNLLATSPNYNMGTVNGEIRVSPRILFDTDKVMETLASFPAEDIQKMALEKSLPRLQEQAAAQQIGIYNQLNEFKSFVEQNGLQNKTDLEKIQAFEKNDPAWYSKLNSQVKLGIEQGWQNLILQGQGLQAASYDLFNMATGSQTAKDWAVSVGGSMVGRSKYAQDINRMSEIIGGSTVASQIASTVTQQLPQLLIGLGVGSGIKGVAALAGREILAETAAKIGFRTSVGLAGLQSFASTFAQSTVDQYNKLKDAGLPEDQAVDMAMKRSYFPALAQGITDATLTGLSGMTGAERVFTLLDSKAYRGTITTFLKSASKDMLMEGPVEEGVSQLIQGIRDKLTTNPEMSIADMVKNTLEASLLGGVIGGAFGAGAYGLQTMRARNNIRMRSDALEKNRLAIASLEDDARTIGQSMAGVNSFKPSDNAMAFGAKPIDQSEVNELISKRESLSRQLENKKLSSIDRNELENELALADLDYYNALKQSRNNLLTEQTAEAIKGITGDDADAIRAVVKIANGKGLDSLTGRERVAAGITKTGTTYSNTTDNPLIEVGKDGSHNITETARKKVEDMGLFPVVRMISLSKEATINAAQMSYVEVLEEQERARQDLNSAANDPETDRLAPESAEAAKNAVNQSRKGTEDAKEGIASALEGDRQASADELSARAAKTREETGQEFVPLSEDAGYWKKKFPKLSDEDISGMVARAKEINAEQAQAKESAITGQVEAPAKAKPVVAPEQQAQTPSEKLVQSEATRALGDNVNVEFGDFGNSPMRVRPNADGTFTVEVNRRLLEEEGKGRTQKSLEDSIKKMVDEEVSHAAGIRAVGVDGLIAMGRSMTPEQRLSVAKKYFDRGNYKSDADYNKAVSDFAGTSPNLTADELEVAHYLIAIEHLRQVDQMARTGEITEDVRARFKDAGYIRAILTYLSNAAKMMAQRLKLKFDPELAKQLENINKVREQLSKKSGVGIEEKVSKPTEEQQELVFGDAKPFDEISESHKRFAESLNALIKGGALTESRKLILQEIFRNTNPRTLDLVSDMRAKKGLKTGGASVVDAESAKAWIELAEGAVKKFENGVKGSSFWNNAMAEPTVLLLHEYGHIAYWTVLNDTDRNLVDSVYEKLKKEGKLESFISKGMAGSKAQIKYLAKNPREFLVQSFAEYLITRRVPDNAILPIMERLRDKFFAALKSIRRRAKLSPEARMIEPIFEKMIRGIDSPKIPSGFTETNGKTVAIYKEGATEVESDLATGVTTMAGGGVSTYGMKGILRPILAVEMNPNIAEAYKENFGGEMRAADMTRVDMSHLSGMVDSYQSSPVCKEFSKRKADAAEKETDIEVAKGVVRHIEQTSAQNVLIENVPDYKKSESLKIIKQGLDKLGYIYDEGVYAGNDYGSPTDRKRYFLRATKKGGVLPPPIKVNGPSWYSVIKDMIDDLPDTDLKRAEMLKEYLIKKGIDINNIKEPTLVSGSEMFKSFLIRKMNEPAFTILASDKSTSRVFLPDGRIKKLNARAKARLTGIPDEFILPENETLATTIVGNGIPTDMIKNIYGPVVRANPRRGVMTEGAAPAKIAGIPEMKDVNPEDVRADVVAAKTVGTSNPTAKNRKTTGVDQNNNVELSRLREGNPKAYRTNALLLAKYPIVAKENKALAATIRKLDEPVDAATEKLRVARENLANLKEDIRKKIAKETKTPIKRVKVSAIEAFVAEKPDAQLSKRFASMQEKIDSLVEARKRAAKVMGSKIDAMVKDEKKFPMSLADKIYSTLIDVVESNLEALVKLFPKDIKKLAKLWYDGANRIAQSFSSQFSTSIEQAAGVLAVFSPQKDWFMNVELARRAMRIWSSNQDTVWSKEMSKRFIMRAGEPSAKYDKEGNIVTKEDMISPVNPLGIVYERGAYPVELDEEGNVIVWGSWNTDKLQDSIDAARKFLSGVEGKKLSELDIKQQARFIRMYSEVNDDPRFPKVRPDGEFSGFSLSAKGKPLSLAWGGYVTIEKAIRIMSAEAGTDAEMQTISDALGDQHKVRSFYNNIADPMNKSGHVTMDTHAIAALLWMPLSGASTEVTQNFGGAGTSSDSNLGLRGLYAAFAEAYRRAAENLSKDGETYLPREIQSITWEAVRMLFTAEWKRGKDPTSKVANTELVDNIWNSYENENRTIDEIRAEIFKLATGGRDIEAAIRNGEGVGIPNWAEVGDGRPSDRGGEAYDAGVVSEAGTAGSGTGRGAGGRGLVEPATGLLREVAEGRKPRTLVEGAAAPEDFTQADKDYLDAVEKGDLYVAQRMVDELANRIPDGGKILERNILNGKIKPVLFDVILTDNKETINFVPFDGSLKDSVSSFPLAWIDYGEDTAPTTTTLNDIMSIGPKEADYIRNAVAPFLDYPDQPAVIRDEAGKVVPLSERFATTIKKTITEGATGGIGRKYYQEDADAFTLGDIYKLREKINTSNVEKEIAKYLSKDLLDSKWAKIPAANDATTHGQCWVSAEAAYDILGGAKNGWEHRTLNHKSWPEGLNPGETHHFIRNKNTGQVIDPTRSQFGNVEIPYDNSIFGGAFMGKTEESPSIRAKALLHRMAIGKRMGITEGAAAPKDGYRQQVVSEAKVLGLPATGSTASIKRLVDIAKADPKTWTPEQFEAIAPELSIHQDVKPNSAERVDAIMSGGLEHGMVDSVDNWLRGGWTWAKGKLFNGDAYLFISGGLKYMGERDAHLAAGNIPLVHIKTSADQSLYEAIKSSATSNPAISSMLIEGAAAPETTAKEKSQVQPIESIGEPIEGSAAAPEDFTQTDKKYLQLLKNQSENISEINEIIKSESIKNGYTLEVWHGGATDFNTPSGLRGPAAFTSLKKENAIWWANAINEEISIEGLPKRFEGAKIIGPTIRKWAVRGEIFDPQNKNHIRRVGISENNNLSFTWEDYEIDWSGGMSDLSRKIKEAGFSGYLTRESSSMNFDDVAIFDAKNIKSLDAIVRDDFGNIILPSKRFNPNSSDLRGIIEVQPIESIGGPIEGGAAAPYAESDQIKDIKDNGIVAVHFSRTPIGLDKNIDISKIKGASTEYSVFGRGFYAMEPRDESMWKNVDRFVLGENRNDVKVFSKNPIIISPETVNKYGFDSIKYRIDSGDYDAIVVRGWNPEYIQLIQERLNELWTPVFPSGKTTGNFLNIKEFKAANEKAVRDVVGISANDYSNITRYGWDQNQIFIPAEIAPDIVSLSYDQLKVQPIESIGSNILVEGATSPEDTMDIDPTEEFTPPVAGTAEAMTMRAMEDTFAFDENQLGGQVPLRLITAKWLGSGKSVLALARAIRSFTTLKGESAINVAEAIATQYQTQKTLKLINDQRANKEANEAPLSRQREYTLYGRAQQTGDLGAQARNLANRLYNVLSNPVTVSQAEALINGMDITYAMDVVKDLSNGIPGAVRSTAGMIVAKRWKALKAEALGKLRRGEIEQQEYLDVLSNQVAFFDWLQDFAKDSGQTVQSFRLWRDLGPDGIVYKLRKDFRKAAAREMKKIMPEIMRFRSEIESGDKQSFADAIKANIPFFNSFFREFAGKKERIKTAEERFKKIAENLAKRASGEAVKPVKVIDPLSDLVNAHIRKYNPEFIKSAKDLGLPEYLAKDIDDSAKVLQQDRDAKRSQKELFDKMQQERMRIKKKMEEDNFYLYGERPNDWDRMKKSFAERWARAVMKGGKTEAVPSPLQEYMDAMVENMLGFVPPAEREAAQPRDFERYIAYALNDKFYRSKGVNQEAMVDENGNPMTNYRAAFEAALSKLQFMAAKGNKKAEAALAFSELLAPHIQSFPVSDKVIIKFMEQKAKQLEISLVGRYNEWYKSGGPKTREALAAKFVDEIMVDIAENLVSPKDTQTLINRLMKDFETKATARRKAALERYKIPRVTKEREIPRPMKRFLELVNMGALTDEVAYQIMAPKYGLPAEFNAEFAARIEERIKLMQDMPEGEAKKLEVQSILTDIKREEGFHWSDVASGGIYTNMLSNLDTSIVNTLDTFIKVWSNALIDFITTGDTTYLSRIAKGYGKGWEKALRILKTGKRLDMPGLEERAPTVFEMIKFGKKGGVPIQATSAIGKFLKALFESKVATPLNAFKYVSRLLEAQDAMNFTASVEGQRWQEAFAEAKRKGHVGEAAKAKAFKILNLTDEKWQECIEQAKKDFASRSKVPTQEDIVKRALEIQDDNVPDSIKNKSFERGMADVLRGQPKGFAGWMSTKFNSMIMGIENPVARAAAKVTIAPFVVTPTNLFNVWLDYSPYGYKRLFFGTGNLFNEKFYFKAERGTPEWRAQFWKANSSVLVTSVLFVLMKAGIIKLIGKGPDDPEEKKDFIDGNNKQYSIQIGNGPQISFKYTPWAIPLTIMANVANWNKYQKDKDASLLKRYAVAMAMTPQIIMELPFFQGPADILELLNPKSNVDYLKRMENFAAGKFGTLFPSFISYVDKIFDPKQYKSEMLGGAFIDRVPFARRTGTEVLNYWGRPINETRGSIGQVLQRYFTMPDPSIESQVLAKFDIYPYFPKPDKTYTYNSKGERVLADQKQREQAIKTNGKIMSDFIKGNKFLMDGLNKELTPQEQEYGKKMIENAAEKARKAALYSVGGQ